MRQSDLDFLALLPDSIATDPTIMALAEAVGSELRRAGRDIPLVRVYSRLDELEEPVLSLLAWQFNVLFWESGLDVATKRELIRRAIPWRRIHGTAACVEQAVALVCGVGCTVVPWWEYDGDPGRFRLAVGLGDSGLDQVRHARMLQVARRAKNVRSHLDALAVELSGEVEAPVRMGAAVLHVVAARYLPAVATEGDVAPALARFGSVAVAYLSIRTTPAILPA